MDRTYWQKQTTDAPLFPALLWSRPENKRHAGKLLVIGGNLHGFSTPAAAYNEARRAGVGSCRVILPDALQRTVSAIFPAAEYAPSTAVSGGFARAALDTWLAESAWADGVLLAGDMGRNSETAIVLESYLQSFKGAVVLAQDAVDYCLHDATGCLDRPNTMLVLTLAQLQKLGTAIRFPAAFTSGMALLQLVEQLHDISSQHPVNLIVIDHAATLVAVEGRVSTTALGADPTTVAAHAAVWWLQNPTQPYEAVTSSLL